MDTYDMNDADDEIIDDTDAYDADNEIVDNIDAYDTNINDIDTSGIVIAETTATNDDIEFSDIESDNTIIESTYDLDTTADLQFDDIQDSYEAEEGQLGTEFGKVPLNDSQEQRMGELTNAYASEVDRVERLFDDIQSDDNLSDEERVAKMAEWKSYALDVRNQITSQAEDIINNEVDPEAFQYSRFHSADKNYMQDNQSEIEEPVFDDIQSNDYSSDEEKISQLDNLNEYAMDVRIKSQEEDIFEEDIVNEEDKFEATEDIASQAEDNDYENDYKFINPDLIPSDEEAERLNQLEQQEIEKKNFIANELKEEYGVGDVDFSDFDIQVAEQFRDSIKQAKEDFPELSVSYIGSSEKQQAGLRYMFEQSERERLEYIYGDTKSSEELDEISRQSAFEMIRGTVSSHELNKPFAVSTRIRSGDSRLKAYEGISVINEFAEDPHKFNALKKYANDNKHSPIGCDTAKSTIDHEIGHEIDQLVGARNDEFIKQLYEDMKNRDAGKEELSGYAQSNVNEFIAEAYAEYRNNPDPREISRKVYSRLKELYSGLNKGGNP